MAKRETRNILMRPTKAYGVYERRTARTAARRSICPETAAPLNRENNMVMDGEAKDVAAEKIEGMLGLTGRRPLQRKEILPKRLSMLPYGNGVEYAARGILSIPQNSMFLQDRQILQTEVLKVTAPPGNRNRGRPRALVLLTLSTGNSTVTPLVPADSWS
jgi:hypothetical protein